MNLAEESEAYQAMLETVRTHPDNEEAQDDLIKARHALEVAWLNAKPTEGSHPNARPKRTSSGRLRPS